MRDLANNGLTGSRVELNITRNLSGLTGLNKDKKKNEIIPKGVESNYRISLVCDNAFSTPRITRKFSFFERVFHEFLMVEIENNLFERFKKILAEEDGITNASLNIKSQLVNYIEMLFSDYLEKNEKTIKDDLENLSSDNFPKILWKRARNLGIIQVSDDDIKNGFLVFVVMSEEVAKQKNNIHNDKEIKALIENTAYKHALNVKNINAYCYTASDSDLIKSNMPLPIKQKITDGYIKLTLIPTNDYTKNNFTKVVYLNKMYSLINK